MEEDKKRIPIWKKSILTVAEAAAFSGIGVDRLYELSAKPDCPFVIFIGSKRGIKRKKFVEYLDHAYSI